MTKLTIATNAKKVFLVAELYGKNEQWELKPVSRPGRKKPTHRDTECLARELIAMSDAIYTIKTL